LLNLRLRLAHWATFGPAPRERGQQTKFGSSFPNCPKNIASPKRPICSADYNAVGIELAAAKKRAIALSVYR